MSGTRKVERMKIRVRKCTYSTGSVNESATVNESGTQNRESDEKTVIRIDSRSKTQVTWTGLFSIGT